MEKPERPRKRLRQAGFTLVEILVVVLILGVLIAVSAPSFLGQAEKAYDSEAQQQLAVGYKAAKAAATEGGGDYPSAAALASSLGLVEPGLTFAVGDAGIASDPTQVFVDGTGPDASSAARVVLHNQSRAGKQCTLDAARGAAMAFSCQIVVSTPEFPPELIGPGPSISGTAQDGQTLTALPGSWSDSPTISYQWARCTVPAGACSDVGSDSDAFTLSAVDVGHTMKVTVTATNDAGSGSDYANSARVLGLAPVNLSAPSLSGSSAVGGVLTVSDGTWAGTPPLSYSHQWQKTGSYPNAVLGTAYAPSAYWRLGESGSSNRLDSSGNASHLTAWLNPGSTTGALAGDSDLALVPYIDGFTGEPNLLYRTAPIATARVDFTLSLWAKWDGVGSGTQQNLVLNGDNNPTSGWGLQMNTGSASNNHLFLQRYGLASYDTTYTMPAGQWVHLELVVEAGTCPCTMRLYVNGALYSSRSDVAVGTAPAGSFTIGGTNGALSGDGQRVWRGSIDEVAYFPAAAAQSGAANRHAAGINAPSWSNISGQTGTSYTVQAGDRGAQLRAQVTATNSCWSGCGALSASSSGTAVP